MGASSSEDRAVVNGAASVSAVPASVPSAGKRNWRGQFIKDLRQTPPDSREWLIWSRYHRAWHRRSSGGGACGYTNDIASAGLFIRAKASEYHDGDRNEAFHASEVMPQLRAAMTQLEEGRSNLLLALLAGSDALARIETRRAKTGAGLVHESRNSSKGDLT